MRWFDWLFRKPAAATQDYQIFVSYSRNDGEIVTPLVQMLRLGGTGIFRDTDHIRPGTRWRTVLIDAVENCQLLLLFWCHHAAQSMEVKREYLQALQQGKLLSPVLLDDTPLAGEIAEFQAIDMRGLFRHAAPEPVQQESSKESGQVKLGRNLSDTDPNPPGISKYTPPADEESEDLMFDVSPPPAQTSWKSEKETSIRDRLGRVRTSRVEIDYCKAPSAPQSSASSPVASDVQNRLLDGLARQLAVLASRQR